MIPARYSQLVFSLILSGLMSFIVTGVATFTNMGFGAQLFSSWMGAWSVSWPIAFLVAFLAAPHVRKLVSKLVQQPQQQPRQG
ncbi:DUF2798 domain-containing protein [Aliisedimentitalea scapharcae]|uniref:DUF2798 domain-containing protein n=1 Tax=Aliisedimentitalea scapharcae TaxID=1524259 RepID=A0ABZ2XRN1_9RHOB|nr:DUF2798 domain-containing protein [Rhodobacteraceae bacterium M382]